MERLNTALSGRYRIERELGAGGMATVYLAQDLKHNRQVAIKVLKPELAAMVGATRFLGEIETTANLHHPHILPLFDSGQADGFLYYVMPWVDGESLEDRLQREKQLPVDEALAVATKVAGALQAAHDQGVIHRDIKPANILLQNGEPLVADFGIALAVQEAGGGRLTETGLSLGTPYYMSPEQAMADRDPDARSDLYSLACVLYEMLSGDPPHTGSTAQAVVAKILTHDPGPVSESRRSVPEHVDRALRKALERLPADRFPRVADFAAALQGKLEVTGRVSGPSAQGAGMTASGRGWAILAILALAVAAAGWLRTPAEGLSVPGSVLAIPTPNVGGTATATLRQVALTPDGRTLIFAGISDENRTFRRDLHDTRTVELPQTQSFLSSYLTSPDGSEFVAMGVDDGYLYRYSIDGGNERIVSQDPPGLVFFDWADDGALWFAGDGREGLIRMDLAGNQTRVLGEELFGHTIQQVLPGASTALMIQAASGVSSGPLVAADLATGAKTVLIPTDVASAAYTAGALVVVRPDGTLHGALFDPSSLTLRSDLVQLDDGVLSDQGVSQLTVSRNGTVAYIPDESRDLVLVQRDGSSRSLVREGQSFHAPSFSPSGDRVAVDFITGDGRNVWVVDLDDGIPTRATFRGNGHDPRWIPGGASLSYLADTPGEAGFGIFRSRPGDLEPDSLIARPTLSYSGEWLGDGSALVTTANGLEDGSGPDLVIVRDGGRGEVEPLLVTRFAEAWPAISPDDRWLAYVSDRSGRFEVYVRPLAGEGPEIQVSRGGGSEPRWNPRGGELFFRSGPGFGTELVAAGIQTEPELRVTSRTRLFSMVDIATGTPHTNYDVSPDGETFVMVRFNPSSRIMVIQNLPDVLERRGAVAR
ncbi:MAG TPA: protein kinase [Longimicrobiales bacterium]|nr:protein kinase [Longimicrobiales bacterium]